MLNELKEKINDVYEEYTAKVKIPCDVCRNGRGEMLYDFSTSRLTKCVKCGGLGYYFLAPAIEKCRG